VLHVDPRRGTGVDWHLSGGQPAQRTGSGAAANPKNSVKHL